MWVVYKFETMEIVGRHDSLPEAWKHFTEIAPQFKTTFKIAQIDFSQFKNESEWAMWKRLRRKDDDKHLPILS